MPGIGPIWPICASNSIPFFRGRSAPFRLHLFYRLCLHGQIESAPPDNPKSLPSAVSFLAPAALVLLPALALALAPGDKNEAYEWSQHRVAGLSFAAAFASVVLGGCWRKGWLAALAAVVVLTVFVGLVARGLPGFDLLFAVAGGIVAWGYWNASRQPRPALLEIVSVGFCSVLSFWAVSRLSWWQPLEVTLDSWPNKLIFLGVTALLAGCLDRFACSAEPPIRSKGLTRCIDALALFGLAAAVMRTNSLSGNFIFPHHWSVYTAPADLVREGRVLLGEVPSQYGFLPTLVLASLPIQDTFTALYWLNAFLILISGAIVYFALRTWLPRWYWQICAGLITIAGVGFLDGDASKLPGPMLYPSAGALRFIWVHVLLGFLLWRHLATRKTDLPSDRRTVWAGSFIWLAGVLWSVESAVYVTAAWLPAGALLAMNPIPPTASRLTRIQTLMIGIGHSALIAAFMLVCALFVLGSLYWFGLGRMPEWNAYWEYAIAFSQGFGAVPIEPRGGVWVLLLLHAAFLAAVVSLDLNRHRSAVVLIWAAWGALWTTSTYYVSRSQLTNLTNLSPVLLLAVGLMVHAVRTTSSHHLVRPWIWLTVPSFGGAILWLVLTNSSTLSSQIANYAVEPQVSRLLPPAEPAMNELITQCLARQPGRYSVIGHSRDEVIRLKPNSGQQTWLPVASLPLLAPLPIERQFAYLDIYRRNQMPGWFIAPDDIFEPTLRWLYSYLNSRYVAKIALKHKGWTAWYCVPNPAFDVQSAMHD